MILTAIHGAFSSPTSFNYIFDKSKHVWQYVDYSEKTIGIEEIIGNIWPNIKQDTIIVGHSLGGVIGALMIDHPKIHGLITIGSPLGGINLNRMFAIYMTKSFVSELKPSGKIVKDVKFNLDDTEKEVYNIITTRGHNPFIFSDNDGVVELSSQRSTPHQTIHMHYGHNEIMTAPDTVKTIDILAERIKDGL